MTWSEAFDALFNWRTRRTPEPHTDFTEPAKPLPVDLPDEFETEQEERERG